MTANSAEVLVTDRDGLGGPPLLVYLLARTEEVNITFKRRLEQFFPVLEIGENRAGLRRQFLDARPKNVGHLAFIDKYSQLRLTHGEGRTVLNLHIDHGKTPGQCAVVGPGLLNDVQ